MALTEEQITLASKFIENCLELGEASAKFDVCYLLQSAFAADDELIHFTSKNPPDNSLLHAKRNIVQFAKDTTELSPYQSLASTKKNGRTDTFKLHVNNLLDMSATENDSVALHTLQAKATYSSQIVSGMIFSPSHFPRLNVGKSRADSGGSFGYDESDEFSIGLPPPPGGLSVSQQETQAEER